MQSSPRIEELRQKFHENPRRYFAPLANEYRKAGDPEQAIAICRAHLAQQPGHMSGHVVYGQALYDARRVDEAKTVFQQALALDPENAIVLRRLGDIARQAGEVDEARTWYSRALDADPQDSEIAAYLAELSEPAVVARAETETSRPIVSAGEMAADVAAPEEEWSNAAADTSGAEAQTAIPELLVSDPPMMEGVTGDLGALSEFEMMDSSVSAGHFDEENATSALTGSPADDSPYLETPEKEAEAVIPAQREDFVTPRQTRRLRTTPPGETSPIVTRTLAELYLQQGHIEPALEIYRLLAEREPHDTDIRARITEILAGRPAEFTPATEMPAFETPTETPTQMREAEASSVETPSTETPSAAAPPAAGETTSDFKEEAAGAGEMSEPDSDWIDAEAAGGATHFTETELVTELWNTADSWGAGYFNDTEETEEIFGLTDDAADIFGFSNESAAAVGESTAAETEILPADDSTETESPAADDSAEPESPAADDSAETIKGEGAEEPEETQEPISAQPGDTEAFTESAAVDEAEIIPTAPEQETERAFAPQEPAARRGPTIREFFATLGAVRPLETEIGELDSELAASAEEEQPYASSTATPPQPGPALQPEYAYADDAFANLFGGAPVAEEDSRAAAALSAAVAHGAPFSAPQTPAESPAIRENATTRASPDPAQESEEDIRRFREWLDGLAES
jgi:tetratricopeptide (TPR) repeat protein